MELCVLCITLCIGMADKDERSEVVTKTDVSNLVASPDIRFQSPSEFKLNKNDDQHETTNQELFLSVNICIAPLND